MLPVLIPYLAITSQTSPDLIGFISGDNENVHSLIECLNKLGLGAYYEGRCGAAIFAERPDLARKLAIDYAEKQGFIFTAIPEQVTKHRINRETLRELEGTWDISTAERSEMASLKWTPLEILNTRVCIVDGRAGKWDYFNGRLQLYMGDRPKSDMPAFVYSKNKVAKTSLVYLDFSISLTKTSDKTPGIIRKMAATTVRGIR
ncbi:MAG TPA: hypothetical protein VGL56_11955 [Fimbriimonadaceae bacterium]|jgi:hypothetical protein